MSENIICKLGIESLKLIFQFSRHMMTLSSSKSLNIEGMTIDFINVKIITLLVGILLEKLHGLEKLNSKQSKELWPRMKQT